MTLPRVRTLMILAVALSLGLTACGGPSDSGSAGKDPIQIGVLLPLTGPLSPLGKEMYDGYLLAQQTINDQGGVNGRKIEFKASDAPTPEAAVSVAQQLSTNSKISVILGSYSSSIAIPASAVASRNKKPYWETGSVAAETTGRGLKYLYRTVVSSDMPVYRDSTQQFIAGVAAPALHKDVKALRLGLVFENGTYGTAASDGFKALAKAQGYNVVAEQSYSATTNDLSSVIQKLKSANIDVLYAVPGITDAILLMKQSGELGFKPGLIIGNGTGFTSPDFLKGAGEAANGIVVSDAVPAHITDASLSKSLSPPYGTFVKAFTDKFGHEPLTHATLGYMGAMVLFQNVLPKADPNSADSIDKAAKAVDIPEGGTVAGMGVKFDPASGQNTHAGWYFMQYQQSKLVTIYPKTFATNDLIVRAG